MVNYSENTAGLIMSASADAAAHERISYRAAKRSFDVAVSFAALVLLAVPMLIIAVVIRLDSKGSAVFCQRRVGRDGKLFNIYKFRTMVISAPSETATRDLEVPYTYITRVGEFLRKTSLDELPQLINVLRGDMSIVGPRPLIVGETDVHELRRAAGVYSVRPGITGWAQINGRDDVSVDEKVRLDAEYVERCSISFDIQVLLSTFGVVARQEGYAEGARKSEK